MNDGLSEPRGTERRSGRWERRDALAREAEERAERRDWEADELEATWRAGGERGGSVVRRVVDLAAEARRAAAEDRARAAQDREIAAEEMRALAQRVMASETDALTGAWSRGPGLRELTREIARARRTALPLTVAFSDVVGLKAVNDTLGHEAGDELLTTVVRVMRQRLRPYDLVVRVGGDEFLCVMSSTTLADAQRRFAEICRELSREDATIVVGLAELTPGDDAASLMRRADAGLGPARRRLETRSR